MSKFCCGIEHDDNEVYCRNCGKVLPDVEDSAFVPEEDYDSSPTVVIDTDSVNRLAGAGHSGHDGRNRYAGRNGYAGRNNNNAGEYEVQSDSAFGYEDENTQTNGTIAQQNGATGTLGRTGALTQGGATGALNHTSTLKQNNFTVAAAETTGGKHIGLLITSIVVLSIAVLGFISMIFLTYQYTISSDGNKYSGAAGKGFVDDVIEPALPGANDIGGDD